jgi:hypothetical protein
MTKILNKTIIYKIAKQKELQYYQNKIEVLTKEQHFLEVEKMD